MSCLNRASRLSSLRGKLFQFHCKRNSSLPVSSAFTKSSQNNNNNNNIFTWYCKKLESHPLLTKSVTASLIAGTGDACCQFMSLPQWNWKRTSRFMLVGFLYSAPVRHYYFNFLARSFAGSCTKRVAQRVFLERGVLAPVSLALWLTTMWTLESLTGETAETGMSSHSPLDDVSVYWDKFSSTYPNLLLTSWSLWTPIMALNFRFVPVQYQVLCVNAFNLLWNMYLSYVGGASHHPVKEVTPRWSIEEEHDEIMYIAL